MPEMLKFLARNCVSGILASWVALAALIFTDTAGLGTLIMNSSQPIVPIALLASGFAVTFGGIAMAAAVMLLPYKNDNNRSKGLMQKTASWLSETWFRAFAAQPRPIPIRVRHDDRRRTRR